MVMLGSTSFTKRKAVLSSMPASKSATLSNWMAGKPSSGSAGAAMRSKINWWMLRSAR